MPKLTRDQLVKFLPDHESVRAFEQLFDTVNEVWQLDTGDLSTISGISRTENLTPIERRINSLESIQSRTINTNSLDKKIEILETAQCRTQNLNLIELRLNVLESRQNQKQNLNEIHKRLEYLESMVG